MDHESKGTPVMSQAPDSLLLIREKIQSLQEALLQKHPRMPFLLQEIHTALKAQPENVTLLEEEEIQLIVSGLQHHTKVFLAETVTKGKGKAGITAKIKSLGDDAF
jgi:hypothetical protein